MRTCARCKLKKPEFEFYKSKTKVKGGVKYFSSACKACDAIRTARNIRKLRPKLVAYGGGKCVRCGYARCVWALEFHHRDQSKKDFNIKWARSLNDKVKTELDKCDLLCANCHREEHYKQFFNVVKD